MKRIKRTAAGIVAASIVTMNVSSFYANAIGLPSAPNSKFEYEFFAEPISRNEVKVTFEVTNNPGTNLVGIAFLYDESTCTKKGISFSDNLIDESYFIFQHYKGTFENAHVVEISNPILHMGDKYDCFSVSMTFEVDENTSWHEFSTAVCSYNSYTENINYNNLVRGVTPDAETSMQTCPYILGDVNDDKQVDVSDSTATLSICGNYGDKTDNKTISVEYLNDLISNGEFVNNDKLSGMLCAEAADVDKNNNVQMADANAILEYYANSMSGVEIESIIGNAEVKTVIV